MPFNMRAGYNFGGVDDGMGQGFSPLDLKFLQEKFISGSSTPNMVISFGEKLPTKNQVSDLPNTIHLYDMRCTFQTPTLGLRSQNLHRSGTTRATPAWIVLPKNQVAIDLMTRLHMNAIDVITVTTLAYFGEDQTPQVTEIRTFESCFVVHLEPWGHGDFVVCAFTFVTVKWEVRDFDQRLAAPVGVRCYKFEFDKAIGTIEQ